MYNIYTVPTSRNTRQLVCAYRYKDVLVPAGFETNGEDSPRIAWTMGFPPFKPKYEPAYVVHDHMIKEIQKQEPELSYEEWCTEIDKATQYWSELMLFCEDSWKVRRAIAGMKSYWGCRKINKKYIKIDKP